MSPVAASRKPVGTRWCPKPQQVKLLTELYGRGLRSPNSVQIHEITTYLSSYGKIESKNVFYWFQNHKARERLKLKKQQLAAFKYMHRHGHLPMMFQHHGHHLEFDLGTRACEKDPLSIQTKDWVMDDDLSLDPAVMFEPRYNSHNTMMFHIQDVGARNNRRPIRTLELFPLVPAPAYSNN